MRQTVQLVKWLKDAGYKVCINLMGMSLLSDAELQGAISEIAGSEADVFYFADSFGSMTPEEVKASIQLIRGSFSGKIGFHPHDNQGLAYANALAAMEAGVDILDGTICGIGRGAGNLKLEQLLLALYFRHGRDDVKPFALLDLIDSDYAVLQKDFKWGWDFSYMLSGLENIHPTYCQKLKSNHQYTLPQVARILTEIPIKERASFSGTRLLAATGRVFKAGDEASLASLPLAKLPEAEKILIVARGESLQRHHGGVLSFIHQVQPQVIECNDTGMLDGIGRTVAVLNKVRLEEFLQRLPDQLAPGLVQLVSANSGIAGLPKHARASAWPCAIAEGEFRFDQEGAVVPAFLVGMYAVALALNLKPKQVYFAGFDGYPEGQKRDEEFEMERFWSKLIDVYGGGVDFCTITPSRYKLPARSVYSFLP